MGKRHTLWLFCSTFWRFKFIFWQYFLCCGSFRFKFSRFAVTTFISSCKSSPLNFFLELSTFLFPSFSQKMFCRAQNLFFPSSLRSLSDEPRFSLHDDSALECRKARFLWFGCLFYEFWESLDLLLCCFSRLGLERDLGWSVSMRWWGFSLLNEEALTFPLMMNDPKHFLKFSEYSKIWLWRSSKCRERISASVLGVGSCWIWMESWGYAFIISLMEMLERLYSSFRGD